MKKKNMQEALGIKSLNNEWSRALQTEFNQEYFKELLTFLEAERQSQTVFPKLEHCFKAFNCTPLSKVKVVILGQDPYHGEGQAHGLSFSVPNGVRVPPSLRNIFKELHSAVPDVNFSSGDLSTWADQGVLLLNSVLTVRSGAAGSHRNKGWELFTDEVLSVLNKQNKPIVFMLWGSYAHKKAEFLSNPEHLILKAPHPSPLSAYRGFLGCKHFQLASEFFKQKKISSIDWGT